MGDGVGAEPVDGCDTQGCAHRDGAQRRVLDDPPAGAFGRPEDVLHDPDEGYAPHQEQEGLNMAEPADGSHAVGVKEGKVEPEGPEGEGVEETCQGEAASCPGDEPGLLCEVPLHGHDRSDEEAYGHEFEERGDLDGREGVSHMEDQVAQLGGGNREQAACDGPPVRDPAAGKDHHAPGKAYQCG